VWTPIHTHGVLHVNFYGDFFTILQGVDREFVFLNAARRSGQGVAIPSIYCRMHDEGILMENT
jgi:hypothetical protein